MSAVLKPAQEDSHDPSSWRAQLSLRFAPRAGKTALTHRLHQGPLVVQRPFYPEGEICHLYLLHPPGGVVGGDHLQLNVELEAGAQTLITTPASGKFYRSAGATAILEQTLQVSNEAMLEWLPQDTILFAGSQVDMLTRVELESGARFIGWEILCLGRPSSGETFDHGHCRQRFELWRGQRPLAIDRSQFSGGDELLDANWGLQGNTVNATLLATPCTRETVQAVREGIADTGFSASLIDDVLVCRYLGKQGEDARRIFSQAWSIIRPHMNQKPACPPRVWAT